MNKYLIENFEKFNLLLIYFLFREMTPNLELLAKTNKQKNVRFLLT